MDRYAADRMVKRLARRGRDHQAHQPARLPALVHHRSPRRRRAPADVGDAASHADPKTTTRYDQGGARSIATPPTPWPPSWPMPPLTHPRWLGRYRVAISPEPAGYRRVATTVTVRRNTAAWEACR
jgi:hypothetical protein